MEPRLHINSHQVDGRARLDLEGEFSLSALEDFQQALDNAADSANCIEVDLRRLAFIDSQGIGAMLSAWRAHGTQQDGIVFLIRRYSQPWRALRLTGLSDHLPITEHES